MTTRNPVRTRERILRAALQEFSAKGFAGGRVDTIARRAGINKRMLYHYFGNKAGLFREILRRGFARKSAALEAAPEDPTDSLPYWFDLACRDRDWVRLLEWEALEGDGRLIAGAERRRAFVRGLEKLRSGQARGVVAAELDAGQTLLSMMALTTFPLAFPQITRLVTGLAPTDPTFRKQRAEFLRDFAESFRPRSGAAS